MQMGFSFFYLRMLTSYNSFLFVFSYSLLRLCLIIVLCSAQFLVPTKYLITPSSINALNNWWWHAKFDSWDNVGCSHRMLPRDVSVNRSEMFQEYSESSSGTLGKTHLKDYKAGKQVLRNVFSSLGGNALKTTPALWRRVSLLSL